MVNIRTNYNFMKKKLLAGIVLVGLGLTLSSSVVEARGRTGSIRVGGYNSHGKGSHYVGGYVKSGPALRHR